MSQWQLQQAKSHLSEVVRLAVQQEPQHITVRGEPTVVMLSYQEYLRLTKPKLSLVDFMRQSPLLEEDLDITRDSQSFIRDVEL